ncbi:MAG: hypothetical protein GY822_13015 [Deltaproteobacteria bacterium]|nr:hypothetical protein [Deltaproteobacteria bacterium]
MVRRLLFLGAFVLGTFSQGAGAASFRFADHRTSPDAEVPVSLTASDGT